MQNFLEFDLDIIWAVLALTKDKLRRTNLLTNKQANTTSVKTLNTSKNNHVLCSSLDGHSSLS